MGMVAFKEVFAKMLLYYYVDSTLNSLYDLLDAKVQKCRTDKHTHILPLFLDLAYGRENHNMFVLLLLQNP